MLNNVLVELFIFRILFVLFRISMLFVVVFSMVFILVIWLCVLLSLLCILVKKFGVVGVVVELVGWLGCLEMEIISFWFLFYGIECICVLMDWILLFVRCIFMGLLILLFILLVFGRFLVLLMNSVFRLFVLFSFLRV